jgi:hypothetical protein
MLDPKHSIEEPESVTIYIEKIVLDKSAMFGLLHDNGCIGRYVQKALFCYHYGPLWEFERKVNAPNDGYIMQIFSHIYQGMLLTTSARLWNLNTIMFLFLITVVLDKTTSMQFWKKLPQIERQERIQNVKWKCTRKGYFL